MASLGQNDVEQDELILHAIFNPLMPVTANQPQAEYIEEVQNGLHENEAEAQARQLEIDGVNAAESGHLDESLDFFNRSINIVPFKASGYNNRAQLLRLKGDTDGALADLNKAIELSNERGKVASQALTQRGLLKKVNGNDEEALEDFKKAACLGNEFARTLVTQLNPYAALCNQMLAEVIGKLRRGETDDY